MSVIHGFFGKSSAVTVDLNQLETDLQNAVHNEERHSAHPSAPRRHGLFNNRHLSATADMKNVTFLNK